MSVDDRLRELDFGQFEGRTYEEIEREHPEFFRSWMETPTLVRFPGGESYAELRERVSAALDDIVGPTTTEPSRSSRTAA